MRCFMPLMVVRATPYLCHSAANSMSSMQLTQSLGHGTVATNDIRCWRDACRHYMTILSCSVCFSMVLPAGQATLKMLKKMMTMMPPLAT